MKRIVAAAVTSIFAMGLAPMVAHASPDVELQQTINPGVLSVDIMDAAEVSVANPSTVLTTLATDANCRPVGATGTLGTNAQRIYVDYPDAADNGWSLAIGATNGTGSVWDSGSATYDFNDTTSGGCADGVDVDSVAGRLSLNPSTGTVTADCDNGCTTANVATGSVADFDEGTIDSIELANASAVSNDVWRGYVTGIGVTQGIPAGQVPGAYTLDMTVTVTAL